MFQPPSSCFNFLEKSFQVFKTDFRQPAKNLTSSVLFSSVNPCMFKFGTLNHQPSQCRKRKEKNHVHKNKTNQNNLRMSQKDFPILDHDQQEFSQKIVFSSFAQN